MKLCKDCRHYSAEWNNPYVADCIPSSCRHPSLLTINLETGHDMYKPSTTSKPLELRQDANACDVEGKWFEPAEAA